MERGAAAERLRSVFDTMEAALQVFEDAALRHPASSPAFETALSQFQQAWSQFMTDWRAIFGAPPPLDFAAFRAMKTLAPA